MQSDEKIVLKVGDLRVFPSLGVGEVQAVEELTMMGTKQSFYVLRILDSGARVKVPVDNVRYSNLREVIDKDKVTKVYKILRKKGFSVETTTWNRRYREYQEKIRTGSVFEVAEVLRDLYLLKSDKELSFCEVKLLDQAKSLLIKELAVAQNCDSEQIENEFKEIFNI